MLGRICRSHSDVSWSLYVDALLAKHVYRLPKTASQLTPLALHAGLSTEAQLQVFEPAESGKRKIIIATNIAEVCIAYMARFNNLNRSHPGQCDDRRNKICYRLWFR